MTEDDIWRFGILAVAIVAGYIFAGSIDARLQIRHPSTHARLGTVIDSNPLNRDTYPRMWRWIKFLGYQHFSEKDRLLSVLCIAYLSIGIGILGLLFRAA